MCPHGVRVALVGGEKQIGHVYAERGSGVVRLGVAVVTAAGAREGELEGSSGGAPDEVWAALGDTMVGSSESERSMETGALGVAPGSSTRTEIGLEDAWGGSSSVG